MQFIGFREVSRQEFYDAMGPQNVTPCPRGNWPYSSDFRDPMGETHGKKISIMVMEYSLEENGKVNTRYYLPNARGEVGCE